MVFIVRLRFSVSRFLVNLRLDKLCEFQNEISLPPFIVGFYFLYNRQRFFVDFVMVLWQVPFHFFNLYVPVRERKRCPANVLDRLFVLFEFVQKPQMRTSALVP